MKFLLLFWALFLPATAFAQCGGNDLRPTLTAAQQAEIAERLQDAPYPTGNHWIATKDDRRLNIIGTMHISDPRMDEITEGLAPVIRSADMLLVEATPEAEHELQRQIATKPELAFLTGKTLIDLLPPEDWAALSAAVTARGVPSFMAAKFQPWYLSLILAVSPCNMRVMASGARGLDHRLMDIADEADVPMASLEPVTTIFELFGGGTLEEQLDMLMLGIMPDQVSEDVVATLAAQYFEEAHSAALETSRVISRRLVDMPDDAFEESFDRFMALLVDERNRRWMDVIAATPGNRIVIAAGALHLGGEAGVLNLLAQRGYTLRRAPF